MANTNDLRYIRSENAIRAAFMKLVTEQPIASVTASELCRRAGISRNAFYLHYAGVPALCSALVDELVSDIRNAGVASSKRRTETGNDDALTAEFVSVLAKHEELLRAMLPSDDGTLSKYLAEGIEGALVDAALCFGAHAENLEHKLRCAYSAWGIIGLASRWIAETDRPISEALPRFEELQESCIEASAAYLMRGEWMCQGSES